jgi:Tol biopolymer transport system component
VNEADRATSPDEAGAERRARTSPVSRRGLLAAAGAALALPTSDALAADRRIGGTDTLRLSAGTTFGARVSPDGRWIALDLLGVLWVMPASGGHARRLTSDLFDIAQPDWSPDSGRLVFQSYRAGVFDLWTVRPDGSGLRQLTEGPFDHREPRWSPDGRTIVFSGDASGSYAIQTYDVDSGRVRVLADGPGEEYEPCWSPDGDRVAFVVDNTRIDVVDRTTGRRDTHLTVPAGQVIHQPEWTPDGTGLVHHLTHDGRCRLMTGDTPLVDDQETFPFRVSWLDANASSTPRTAGSTYGRSTARPPGPSASPPPSPPAGRGTPGAAPTSRAPVRDPYAESGARYWPPTESTSPSARSTTSTS